MPLDWKEIAKKVASGEVVTTSFGCFVGKMNAKGVVASWTFRATIYRPAPVSTEEQCREGLGRIIKDMEYWLRLAKAELGETEGKGGKRDSKRGSRPKS